MALTKVTGQVIKNTTDVTVGVLTVTDTLAVGGTVSIGGTLTYEDVTNVDAVGLITARDGIKVGSGITLSVDGDIFTTGISTFVSLNVIGEDSNDGIIVTTENNNVGILSSTDHGAILDLFDDDTQSRIRTVDGRLHLYSDFKNNQPDSAIRFFVDADTEVARVSSSGVGIGTTNPSQLLHLEKNSFHQILLRRIGASPSEVSLRNEGNLAVISNNTAGIDFQTGAGTSSSMRINAAGNVGIGTNMSIGGKLHLSARTGDCKLIIEADNIQDSGTEANNPYIVYRQDGGVDMSAVGNNLFDSGSDHNALYLSNSSGSGGIIFSTGTSNGYTNSTERARFYKTGELLVGIKTSRSVGSKEAAIQIEGTDADSSSLRIYRNAANQNAPALDFGKSRGSDILSDTIVQDGDTIGTISWYAADGTDSNSRTAHVRSEVDGAVGINSTPGRIIFSTTSSGAAQPSERLRINSEGHLNFGGDTNTYIHRPASDTLAVVNGGNESIRIATSAGKIYIGHTAATAISGTNTQLQITGTSNATCSLSISRYTNNTNGNFLFFGKSRGTTIGTYTAVQSGDVIGSIRWCGADGTDLAEGAAEIKGEVDAAVSSNIVPGRLVFRTSHDDGVLTEAMRIDHEGHIGINNTTPSQELDIKAITTHATLRLVGAEGGNAQILMDADEGDDNIDMWRLISSSSEYFALQNYASGAWSSVLVLTGDGTNTDLNQVKIKDGSAAKPSITFMDDSDTGFYRITSNTLGMSFGGIQKNRFEADGDVIFGGSAIEVVEALTIMPNQSQGAARITFNRTARTANGAVIKFNDGGSNVGNISYSNTTVTYDTGSDYRLKFNDTEITDGIERLKKLRPIRFNWKKAPTTRVDGFFAHEVSPVVPDAVRGEKDQVVTQQDIDDGNVGINDKIDDPMYQSMDHSKLVPLLTAALKEEISKREEEINELKERLARAGLW